MTEAAMPAEPRVRPFPLSDVRIVDEFVRARQDRNRAYLLSLDPERLLHNFRLNAGLPTAAAPLGGWEAPNHGLRGHFVGHYLSACAHAYAANRDQELRERGEYLVRELAKCQAALGGGYLAAFPEADLDVIERRFEGAWASYYVVHKIFARLVEAHRSWGDARAVEMAVRLTDYVRHRIDKLPPAQLERMLRTDKPNPTNETGGWSESLCDLYEITGDRRHLELARRFEPEWLLAPLALREDHLAGLHANTHIPIILGVARRYELTGDASCRDAAVYFWERTAMARSYANGGGSGPRPDGREKSAGGEHWPEAYRLANTLTPKICESCVAHNMMRLTNHLFRWTADSRYADFYERAYFNSVLCMQHPGYPGGYIYDHPLGCRCHKKFGHADDAFWCCYGSTVEAYGRLAHGIYYLDGNDELWVNLPVSSELTWHEKGVRIEHRSGLGAEQVSRLTFRCAAPVELAVNLRIPAWAAGAATVAVNGRPLGVPSARPGSFVPVRRTWHNGDVLTLAVPAALRAETMPDDPYLVAFLYGPLLLAARSDEELVVDGPDARAASMRIRPDGDDGTTFLIRLVSGTTVPLVPVNQVVEEAYGVYFRVRP